MVVRAPVRFGILSFAHHHANAWAEGIQECPEAVLTGIWDDDPHRGQDAAARFRTRHWSDLRGLLRECDAVGVTSETMKHAALIEAAAAAGVHILCEKPMAATVEDCERIARAVAASGVVFMQNFPKRFDPINHEVVTRVQRGDLGQVALARIRHGNFHFLDIQARSWFVDPAQCGGGALLDEGIHAADFLRWLLGDPSHVVASVSRETLGLPVDDTALAIFAFPGGARGELCTSGVMVASEQSVEVYGTEGSLLLRGVDVASRDFSTIPYLKVFRRGQTRGTWEESETIPFFAREHQFHRQGPPRFVQCLVRGDPVDVGLEEGRKALEMILAAYRAAETGRREPVTFTPGS